MQGIAVALYYSGLLRLRFFIRRAIFRKKEICILALHRVLPEEQRLHTSSLEGMILKEATFAKMLEFLDQRFRVVSLEDFLSTTESRKSDRRPWCLITFDDGWKDNFTTAYPLLQRFNFPATIFLVTSMIGREDGFWVERLRKAWAVPTQRRHMDAVIAEILPSQGEESDIGLENVVEYAKQMSADKRGRLLERLLPSNPPQEPTHDLDRLMTWEEVMEMDRTGVEMGAHTVTHPILIHEDNETIRHEVRLSKKNLEEKLARTVRAFAYPNGDWNETVRAEVERAGFRCAFTTKRRWYCSGGDLFTIPRIIIHEKKLTGFRGEFSPAVFSLTLSRWR